MAKNEELKVVSNEPVELDSKDETVKDSEPVKESVPEESTVKDVEPPATTEAEKVTETPIAVTSEPIEENAPAPPPRPLLPVSQIKKTLKEAFPGMEDKYITAVVIASQGNLDPAFNALLYLSDPTFEPEITIAPPVPSKPAKNTLTDDEILARQLQKEFEKEDRKRRAKHNRRRDQPQRQDDFDESPDEFEQIKESFTQGIEEARTTLNGWVSGLSKKFNNENANETQSSPKLFGALGGSSFNGNRNRKTTKFDEDPEIISSDFHNKINLSDHDDNDKPKLPQRTQVPESKKWQPLNSDVPINSDAFIVTDSEDEDKK